MSAKHRSLGKNYRSIDKDAENINQDLFFPTYHSLTRRLLNRVKFNQNSTFLEPCAGAGDITKIIKEYYRDAVVAEYDIKPRREGIIQCDFLTTDIRNTFDYTVTNPPFKLFLDFFKRSAKYTEKGIFLIAPLDYLHGVERHEWIYETGYKGFRLYRVYVFVRRPLFSAKFRPDGLMPTGATSFAWFDFQKGYTGFPGIEWFHNNENMGVPTEVGELYFQDYSDSTLLF